MSAVLERFADGNSRLARCPDCDQVLSADAMNIREGVALCPQCGSLTRLSELNTSGRSYADLLANPPAGCALDWDERRVMVQCSSRSLGGFLGALFFTLFWNGIVSVFAFHAMAGLYFHLIGPLPAWFPSAGAKNGVPQINEGPMSLGETLFLCAFLTPFIVVGFVVFGVTLSMLFGKTVAVIDEDDSYVATGIGRLLRKRRFDPRTVQSIRLASSHWNTDENQQKQIEIVADRTIKFGSLLNSNQREWFRVQFHQLLLAPDRTNAGILQPNLRWLRRESR